MPEVQKIDFQKGGNGVIIDIVEDDVNFLKLLQNYGSGWMWRGLHR
jgi:hypothetical protein